MMEIPGQSRRVPPGPPPQHGPGVPGHPGNSASVAVSQGGYPGNPPPGVMAPPPLSPPSRVGDPGAHMMAPNKHLPPLPGQNGAPSPHHSIHAHGSNDHLDARYNELVKKVLAELIGLAVLPLGCYVGPSSSRTFSWQPTTRC